MRQSKAEKAKLATDNAGKAGKGRLTTNEASSGRDGWGG